jgi:ABC-type branched-subunit amino acid transport system substrate-binding protein
MLAMIKRGLALLVLTLMLAACQVIPGDGGPQTPAPAPEPTQAPEVIGPALPTDTDRHRVALLVPLSGENGAVGQSIANATTMALLDTNASTLRITTYDTAGGAREAAARAVADGNRLILGPLMRDNVADVLAEARVAGVPLISFSNDVSVARADAFVMGHVPEQSIRRTAAFAVERGARRFGALVPSGEYGQRALDALSDAVTRAGGVMVASERYDRGNTSVISAAERLRTRGALDAVLVADGARLAVTAAGALREGGSAPTILGPELWSGEEEVARTAALRGAWFSAVSDDRYRQFSESYSSRFGERPYRIATLGYDAVLLALRVAREWNPGDPFPVAQLLDDGGFLGIDGPFRFRSEGVGERAMEVRQVGAGTVSVVSPAPTQF